MIPNQKYINQWLAERNITVERGFAEKFRSYVSLYKNHNLNLSDVYKMLGCTKQNVSYWSLHSYSTQAKKSLYSIIDKSAELFELTDDEKENLANSAGLSLQYAGGELIELLGYKGKKKKLCQRAMISERMLRLYKYETPTKQALIALAVSLDKTCDEIDELLHRYGYCLSDCVIGDLVVKWYLTEFTARINNSLILLINETLAEMSLPLLMTKQS